MVIQYNRWELKCIEKFRCKCSQMRLGLQYGQWQPNRLGSRQYLRYIKMKKSVFDSKIKAR